MTNQLFPILPHAVIEKLKKIYDFHLQTNNEVKVHTVIRLVTSWATPESAVWQFIDDLKVL